MRRKPPQAESRASKLVLVDAHGYLHRAFHALPPLTSSRGEPVGALLGFARMLLKLLREESPSHMAACYDFPAPTFRDKLYPEYKATRPPLDESLKSQLSIAPKVAEAMGIRGLALAGYEADDLLAGLAKRGREEGLEVVLVTGDKDALQLVETQVSVLKPEGDRFDPAKVEAKYGVPPQRLADYFALVGDPTDNVKGVEGVGPVTAARLLKAHGTLERLLQAVGENPGAFSPRLRDALLSFRPRAELTLRLVRLVAEVPLGEDLETFRVGGPDRKLLVPLFQRLEFAKLLQELLPAAEKPGPGTGGKLLTPSGWLQSSKSAPSFAFAVRESPASEGELIPGTLQVGLALADGGVCSSDSAKLMGPLFESGKTKIGHDVKAGLEIFARRGWSVRGPYFDTALAGYLLNPSKAKYELADVALEHLGAPPEPRSGSEAAAEEARLVALLAARLEPELRARGLEGLYREVEMPLLEVLARMEADGIAVDLGYLRDLSREFEAHIHALSSELAKLAGGDVNLHSPKQLAHLLFDTLKLPSQRRIKTGYSTDEETLAALAPLHPFPGRLLEYREWSKLKSTYIDNLLAEADRSGRVHTRFNQFGASTGRLSSLRPNLQNIPVRSPLGAKIRRAFIPRKGWRFLSADYSQIDLRVLAHVTGDAGLCEAFGRGEDIHTQTACDIFGVPPEKADKEMRRRAKAVNFGIVYGQSAHGLGQLLGIPNAEAQRMIQRYFERYPGVKAWIDAQVQRARREGLVRTLTGRLRYLPELSSANGAQRAFAERAAVNTPIQGGSADIIKKAMLAVARRLEEGRLRARMLLQVHDELLFEAPPEELEVLAELVKSEMEGAVRLRVPVLVDLRSGPDWADLEPLGANSEVHR